ncbi:hypothetical protein HF086_011412 [Spodoptera exigua]|uniref:Uncharacterized protein n=1 Tax=Spodoptera exigua TaxID=7107 RepID=A0A922SQW1_SPOEX|nr:hypothetical protein HF086_011412 [Spodoptera exigua]
MRNLPDANSAKKMFKRLAIPPIRWHISKMFMAVYLEVFKNYNSAAVTKHSNSDLSDSISNTSKRDTVTISES